MTDDRFLRRALELACTNAREGGRPYGAVVAREGRIVAEGVNELHRRPDPSAHAEMLALRSAGAQLGRARLDDCTIFASGQPCPMCLAAIHLASVPRLVFAYSDDEGAAFGFSSATLAGELARPLVEQAVQIVRGDPRVWPENPFALASRR